LSLDAAVDITSVWRREYNELRTHSSKGNLTPREFLETYEREEEQSVPDSLEELIETANSGFH